jgi:hypothetical protein
MSLLIVPLTSPDFDASEIPWAQVVLVRIDPQPQAMKISLIGVGLFFRGQLDEICQHSASELRTL